MMLYTKSNSEIETKQTAKSIASFINIGDLILLDGDLGTGKTHFVKGLAEGLGSSDNVTSPTFSLANFYNTSQNFELLHIDLYRIASIDEFNDLGLSDYFYQNIVIIEWGTKFADIFDEFLKVSFSYIENEKDSREIVISSKGNKYINVLKNLNQKLPNLKLC